MLAAGGTAFGKIAAYAASDPELSISPHDGSPFPPPARLLATSLAAGGAAAWAVLERPWSRQLAVAVPAYMAARTIGDVIRRTEALGVPVIVVDDGSTDGTGDAARACGVTVLSHPVNEGKGRALKTAFDHLFAAGYDAVVTIDADGQHPPEELPKLLSAWRDGADLVLGMRNHLYGAMGRVRRASNGTSSWLISQVAGASLPTARRASASIRGG